jgi:hypothetical protein
MVSLECVICEKEVPPPKTRYCSAGCRKAAVSQKSREYYEKNKEKYAEYRQNRSAYTQEYYQKNRDRLKEYRQRPEVKARRKKFEQSEHRKEYLKGYYKEQGQNKKSCPSCGFKLKGVVS